MDPITTWVATAAVGIFVFPTLLFILGVTMPDIEEGIVVNVIFYLTIPLGIFCSFRIDDRARGIAALAVWLFDCWVLIALWHYSITIMAIVAIWNIVGVVQLVWMNSKLPDEIFVQTGLVD